MNKNKNTPKLFLKTTNFSKNQHFKSKRVNKKEALFLMLLLSIFVNTKTFANLIPNKGASAEICNEPTPPGIKSKKAAVTKISELLPIIKLGFEYKNAEDLKLHHQIAISFQATNSFDYDKGYDSESFTENETDIYWKFMDDHRKYVITGVQEISDDLEVPLEIIMAYSGQVDLMVDKIQNISREIYIKDKLTGNSYNLKDGKINLTLDEGICTERFVLAFKESTALSLVNDALIKETTIYADNKNQNIVISKNTAVKINKVELFNILGKQTSLWTIIEEKNSYQLAIKNQIPNGIYIVRLNTDKGIINKKVLF